MKTQKNTKVFGHKKQFNFLVDSYKKRFPHAWLLSGNKGIGKKTTIKKFICCILANDLFDININIDNFFDYEKLISINKSYSTSVFDINNDHENKCDLETIRKIITNVKLTNFSDKHNKFILIDNFDDLNINCKNALLKTIEEPPANTLIFIISHNIKNVPKTILSRCIDLRFNSLNKKDFTSFFNDKNFENLKKINFEKLLTFSDGNPGFFLEMIKLDGLDIIKKVEDIISDKKINHLKIKEIIEKLANNSDFLLNVVVSFFFRHTLSILHENSSNKELYRNIINFLQLLTIKNDVNLNININQILTSIFINYFSLIKNKI